MVLVATWAALLALSIVAGTSFEGLRFLGGPFTDLASRPFSISEWAPPVCGFVVIALLTGASLRRPSAWWFAALVPAWVVWCAAGAFAGLGGDF
jgi:hypothetical protein